MKHNVAILLLLAIVCSCSGGKKNIDPFTAITSEVDSMRHLNEAKDADSLSSAEATTEEEKDGAFDDFIYNFTSDHALQMRRIKFPLPIVDGDKRSVVSKNEWEHEDLFTSEEYYTLLFDSEEEMDQGDDMNITAASVEWLYPSSGTQKQYIFGRKSGKWTLDSISVHPISDAVTAEFIEFYSKFATDSLYQASHISPRLTFVTTDPDDDFSVIETTLDLNQWFAFSPSLPADKLSNICYGNNIDGKNNAQPTNKKILMLKGMGNGLSNVFYFRIRPRGGWELYKFEDVGI
jgi:hypothetical protein